MWSNISRHVPGVVSQSQIRIGMGISRNTERAEAMVARPITVQPDGTCAPDRCGPHRWS